MPRFTDRKKRELRAAELRVILDPIGHEGYKAELARLEQCLALDDELRAANGPAHKRGLPKGAQERDQRFLGVEAEARSAEESRVVRCPSVVASANRRLPLASQVRQITKSSISENDDLG